MKEIDQLQDYKYWFDKNIGFFCNSCLFPVNGGVASFIKNIKKYQVNTLPDFAGQDTLRDNCITYNNKLRPKKAQISFSDKDQKESIWYILPQKW